MAIRSHTAAGLILGDGVLAVRDVLPSGSPRGIMELALAVLEQAVADLGYPPDTQMYRAARDWFWADDLAHPFSACRICELFGWDLGVLRARLWDVHLAQTARREKFHVVGRDRWDRRRERRRA